MIKKGVKLPIMENFSKQKNYENKIMKILQHLNRWFIHGKKKMCEKSVKFANIEEFPI